MSVGQFSVFLNKNSKYFSKILHYVKGLNGAKLMKPIFLEKLIFGEKKPNNLFKIKFVTFTKNVIH